MNNDKYYTPEPSEFCVGVEFEIIDYSSNNYNTDTSDCTWKRAIIKEEDFYTIPSNDNMSQLQVILNYLKSNHIRVKYLDEEDILSLGWVKRTDNSYYIELPGSYPSDLYAILDFRYGIDDIIIETMRSIEIRDSNEEQRVFRGKIKNKHQLKILMQQIGII